jgi:hypothetical protein
VSIRLASTRAQKPTYSSSVASVISIVLVRWMK